MSEPFPEHAVILELFNGETAETENSPNNAGVEVAELPGVAVVEVFETPPDTHYQIGGTDPIADPNILVWYDTQGA